MPSNRKILPMAVVKEAERMERISKKEPLPSPPRMTEAVEASTPRKRIIAALSKLHPMD